MELGFFSLSLNLKEAPKKVEDVKSIQEKLDEFMQDIAETKTQVVPNKETSKQEKPKATKKYKPNNDSLDPMDPASYSDIPR